MHNATSLNCGRVSTAHIGGQIIRFVICDESDPVQRYHAQGRFFASKELSIVKNYIQPGARIVEIGANIGNHTIFFEKFCGVSNNVVFDASQEAIEIFRKNVALNNLKSVDDSFLGIGLSDRPEQAAAHRPSKNLGGTSFVPEEGGDIPLMPADLLLQDYQFDFVKIDVEGSEMKVLDGFREGLRRNRPILFIEIDDENLSPVAQFLTDYGYAINEVTQIYRRNLNVIASPTR